MKENIRNAIYDKYIAPTKKKRPDYIGVEIEMPVVNLYNIIKLRNQLFCIKSVYIRCITYSFNSR